MSSSVADTFSVGTISLVFFVLSVFVLCSILLSAVAANFGHENLIITPERFRIKRTLESLPSARDSVNHPRAAAQEPTCLDEMLCEQVSGNTRNLWKAEVRPLHDSVSNGSE